MKSFIMFWTWKCIFIANNLRFLGKFSSDPFLFFFSVGKHSDSNERVECFDHLKPVSKIRWTLEN